MFANLLIEMRKHTPRITQTEIAKVLGLTGKSVSERFNGKVAWSRDEMFAIRDAFFPEKTIDMLFDKL